MISIFQCKMFPKKGPDISPFKEQLKAILSFKLMSSSNHVLEKLFWFFISFGGTVYILYIMSSQFKYWEANPTLVTKGSLLLSNVTSPAVTFCHKGMQKYAIVERLLNHIDPAKEIPNEVLEIRNEAIKYQAMKLRDTTKILGKIDICSLMKDTYGSWVSSRFKQKDGDCEVC